jgi:hypothetical protein
MAVVKERPTIKDEKGEGAEDSSPKAAIQASLEDIRTINERRKHVRAMNADKEKQVVVQIMSAVYIPGVSPGGTQL